MNAIGRLGFLVAQVARRGAPVLLALGVVWAGPRARAGGLNEGAPARPAGGGLGAAEVVDLAGHRVNPFQKPGKGIVLVFIANDCPISNRYAPEIRRLYEKFHHQGLTFWLVHPDPDESVAAIRKHAEEYRYPMEVLRDPRHFLVRCARVHVTPEAAVFLPDARLVYHGRIDNLYADFGKNRPEATQHDLAAALTAVLSGAPVPQAGAPAVGCYIPDVR
ncbi:MAG: redoxin domain-containing protein [Limisphaerales bacterium]